MARAGDLLEFEEASFTTVDLLGAGAFGQVWKCEVREWKLKGECGTPWKAVKLVRKKDVDMVHDEAVRMKRAIKAAKPDFAPMYYFHGSGRRSQGGDAGDIFGLCMDFVDGITLSSLLDRKQLDYACATVVFKDLLVALRRLHDHGIVHNDVKPDNMLVQANGECYLCDFGVSIFTEDFPEGTEMPAAGTPSYMAPEIFFPQKPRRYGTPFDVWSAGIVGYVLAVGRTPWPYAASRDPEEMFRLLEDIESVSLSGIPDAFFGPRGPWARLLAEMLAVMPQERATVRVALDLLNDTLQPVTCDERDVLSTVVDMLRASQRSRASMRSQLA